MVVQRRTAGQPADQEAMEEGQGQGKPQLAGGMWAGREGCGESASPSSLHCWAAVMLLSSVILVSRETSNFLVI